MTVQKDQSYYVRGSRVGVLLIHGLAGPPAEMRDFVRAALFSGDSTKAGLPRTPGGAVIEHRWLAGVVRDELKNITQPTLIVHPREDDYADLNNAWYLQRNLKGLVDMVVLDDSY